ncbi:glycosyltransferase [Dyadobacter flavalbus]|uniref:Glycosyltransferase n=1 Tax=Dyadobacter flavalbus TaxID=2579942 RepID=A0A5M8QCG9_9BACT|nr:glycosyltransferase [Dyadobacter flavalbus]KAA6432741.1 glycosyltransferase [Dyadobacter flavalbus]
MPNTDHIIQISVLVAARNEEKNIERCLKSLHELEFSKTNIEFIIGDDDSDDQTAEIIKRYIADKPNFIYQKITETLPGLKGKANVLEQLAHTAKGHFFFFCDADIAVPSTWVRAMLAHFRKKTGVVVGVTRMKKSHLLADFISMEWLYVLSTIRLAAIKKIPITGMGNNMAVTREAYFAIGGYAAIGFSVVEDYTLFMAIVRKGYDFDVAFNRKILNISEPVNTWSELLRQRKRWIHGVMESFWATRLTVVVSACLVPAFLILMFWNPELSQKLLLVHYMLITGAALTTISILKQKDLVAIAVLFWFYMVSISVLMLVIYLLPGKTVWKGREYE